MGEANRSGQAEESGSQPATGQSGSTLAAGDDTLLSFLRQVQNDYRGARALFQGIQNKFGLREAEVERIRKNLASDRSSRHLAPPVAHPAVGGGTRNGHLLTVYLLGPFRAFVDDRAITDWHSSRAKLLFKYLVSHRHRHIPRDQLMEALWPEGDPHATNNSLRVAVHALRQVLTDSRDDCARDAFILFEGGSYTWSSPLDFWVDVEEFERHWHAGRRLEKAGDTDQAMREFEAAESLYNGDFLEDDPYEDWTLLRREALKDTQLAMLTKLAERCSKLGDYEGCIVRCQKILERDPCREDAYQRLIRCYVLLGQPGRARRWYEMCVSILRQELDLAPSQETVDLCRRLLIGADSA